MWYSFCLVFFEAEVDCSQKGQSLWDLASADARMIGILDRAAEALTEEQRLQGYDFESVVFMIRRSLCFYRKRWIRKRRMLIMRGRDRDQDLHCDDATDGTDSEFEPESDGSFVASEDSSQSSESGYEYSDTETYGDDGFRLSAYAAALARADARMDDGTRCWLVFGV